MPNIDFGQVVTKEMAQDVAKQRLVQQLAELRWCKENEGVHVTNSAVFQSDRTTRTELASLLTNIALGTIETPVTWKAISGWEMLAEDQMRQVLWLINAHVQSCFAAEREVSKRSDSGAVFESADISVAFEAALKDARI